MRWWVVAVAFMVASSGCLKFGGSDDDHDGPAEAPINTGPTTRDDPRPLPAAPVQERLFGDGDNTTEEDFLGPLMEDCSSVSGLINIPMEAAREMVKEPFSPQGWVGGPGLEAVTSGGAHIEQWTCSARSHNGTLEDIHWTVFKLNIQNPKGDFPELDNGENWAIPYVYEILVDSTWVVHYLQSAGLPARFEPIERTSLLLRQDPLPELAYIHAFQQGPYLVASGFVEPLILGSPQGGPRVVSVNETGDPIAWTSQVTRGGPGGLGQMVVQISDGPAAGTISPEWYASFHGSEQYWQLMDLVPLAYNGTAAPGADEIPPDH